MSPICSNFNFLDATSAPEDILSHYNTPEACQTTPYNHQSALGDCTIQYMVQDHGETALHATAMELDTLLYSKYGEYALDEVTIMLEPIFDNIDDKDIHDKNNLETTAYE